MNRSVFKLAFSLVVSNFTGQRRSEEEFAVWFKGE